MHTYTLDTILTHLRNAGKLEAAAGIVIGEMKNVGWREDYASFMQDFSIEDVLEEVIGPLGIPCIYGCPSATASTTRPFRTAPSRPSTPTPAASWSTKS